MSDLGMAFINSLDAEDIDQLRTLLSVSPTTQIGEAADGAQRTHPASQPTRPENVWLDTRAAARHMSCEPHRIYDLVAQRRICVHRDGRRLRFRVSDLDSYLMGAS